MACGSGEPLVLVRSQEASAESLAVHPTFGAKQALNQLLLPHFQGEDCHRDIVHDGCGLRHIHDPGCFPHGGPGGQARVGYSSFTQYLVNHGYAVIAVNNRGSSGYGKTFFKLDDLNHGKGDLDDCVEAKKFLASTGVVDADNVAIVGASYGGYMVLAALAFRPEEFTAGVDLFGISNWVRTLKSIPPWWEYFREALYAELGNPETDEEYLHSISPLFHADKIVRPLMVLQGANDPRVLQVESDEIVEAVRANGVPVEYMVFEDEGHGFVKKENQIEGYRAILAFLDKHLKKAE